MWLPMALMRSMSMIRILVVARPESIGKRGGGAGWEIRAQAARRRAIFAWTRRCAREWPALVSCPGNTWPEDESKWGERKAREALDPGGLAGLA